MVAEVSTKFTGSDNSASGLMFKFLRSHLIYYQNVYRSLSQFTAKKCFKLVLTTFTKGVQTTHFVVVVKHISTDFD